MEQSAADRAIAQGRLDVAEALLYDAAARTPRRPSARGALGNFLAARGRLLVGATLLDEAIQFGADTATIERRQFEVYRWTGEYERLAALRTAPISSPAREALRRSAGTRAGGAAAATVALGPGAQTGLGRITVFVDGVGVAAEIEPLAEGVTLPASPELAAAIDRVGTHGDTVFAVARSLSIGPVTLGPVPVLLVQNIGAAHVGLDVLSQLTPSFDGVRQTLTVHSGPYAARGRRLSTLLTFPGVTFVATAGQGPVGLHTAAGRAALHGARWTLDVTRGFIVLDTP